MKAMKDKRKFGGASPVSKNRNCKKFGYSYDKEVRSNPYTDSSVLGVPYIWDGEGYYDRWVEQVYKKLNNVI